VRFISRCSFAGKSAAKPSPVTTANKCLQT
jgi:hypothetical protein